MAPTARFGGPLVIQRAADQTLALVVRDGGGPATISSGTLTVYDANWTAVVDGEDISTAVPGEARYALDADEVPVELSLSTEWMSVWSLVIGGTTYEFRRDTVLAYRALKPTVTEADLLDRHHDLRALLPSTRENWQEYLDAAFGQIERRLIADGRRPELIISSWSLFDVHIELTLSNVFRDLETYSTGKGKYAELSDRYRAEYEAHYGQLQFRFYDQSETGKPADAVGEQAAVPVVYLTGRPAGWGWRR